jgi:hypothetical protein
VRGGPYPYVDEAAPLDKVPEGRRRPEIEVSWISDSAPRRRVKESVCAVEVGGGEQQVTARPKHRANFQEHLVRRPDVLENVEHRDGVNRTAPHREVAGVERYRRD